MQEVKRVGGHGIGSLVGSVASLESTLSLGSEVVRKVWGYQQQAGGTGNRGEAAASGEIRAAMSPALTTALAIEAA